MVLKADDELRHPVSKDYYFRESLYFNFNDTNNKIGGWVYFWVTPNKESQAGMLVSFYRGCWPDMTVNDKAMASPGHILRDGERWIYCYKQDVDFQLNGNFDDVELCGLRMRRLEPLKHYKVTFDDKEGNTVDLDFRFMMPPYDYADGVHPTPSWVAANRYHRSHWVTGTLNLGGNSFKVDATGDSDHSWGQRHMGVFVENLFKMWSFQTRDGKTSLSAIQQGPAGKEIALGFTVLDGIVASIASVEAKSNYDRNGVPHDVDLNVVDALGRTVRARFTKMDSHLGSGDAFWGYEGVGDYKVEGFDTVPGLISYFWPSSITAYDLHQGKYK